MASTCNRCPKTFKSEAALNFHSRKVHGVIINNNENVDSREEPVKPQRTTTHSMVRFGAIPGMRDYTKGPFKLFQVGDSICNRITNERLELEETTRKLKTVEADQLEQVRDFEHVKHNVIPVVMAEVEKEREPLPSPILPVSPEMPRLSPQASPVAYRSPKCRPGPKSNHQGRHGKDEQQTDIKKEVPATRPSAARRISLKSESGESAGSDEAETSLGARCFEAALEEKREKERVSGGSSVGSNGGRQIISLKSAAPAASVSEDEDDDDELEEQAPPPPPKKIKIKKTIPAPALSKWSCPLCNRTDFRSQRYYTNHLEAHEGKKPFLCPVCQFGYETEFQLLEHVSIRHSQEAKFNCEKCNQGYKTHRGLEAHIMKNNCR